MNGLPDLVQLLVAAPFLLAFMAIACAPELLAGWAHGKREEAQRRIAQQAELDRKLAIADAAIAARARGERFVPPADYDR